MESRSDKFASLQELTENIEMLSHEKSNLQDQSLMAFEEHEEKLQKIQQQEAVGCIDWML